MVLLVSMDVKNLGKMKVEDSAVVIETQSLLSFKADLMALMGQQVLNQ
jgi:hypothetical protein